MSAKMLDEVLKKENEVTLNEQNAKKQADEIISSAKKKADEIVENAKAEAQAYEKAELEKARLDSELALKNASKSATSLGEELEAAAMTKLDSATECVKKIIFS
ncbi:MAG: hypothetical protein IJT65_04310 [Eubacterium sp.]|nr:hypothetical protein [Eubacterium sp.]